MTKHDSEATAQNNIIEWVPHCPPEIRNVDIIRAGMLYANDKRLFQSEIMNVSIWRQVERTGTWNMEPYWHNLMTCKADDEHLLRRGKEESRKGHLAGWMFAYLYTMSCDKHIEEPSKSKAAYLVSETVKGERWGGSDKGIATTTKTISNAFLEKSSVLHYWAAVVLRHRDDSQFLNGKDIDDEELEKFLQISKSLQNFGITYRSLRNKDDTPPICNNSMWLLSEDIEAVEIILEDTPDELYNHLRNYRAN